MTPKVLVLGAGTAGCAAAIFLAQRGLEVTLIDRLDRSEHSAQPVIGESLSPDAQPLLQELGVWEQFTNAGHLKCFGNVSYWYSNTANHHDFLHHPLGHGWHLDRALFDQHLLEMAISLGVDYQANTQLSSWQWQGEQWQLALTSKDGNEPMKASFVIDATGRNSWWARQQGVERLYEAEQLALVAYLHNQNPFEDSRTLVETVDNGWWYSAAIPGQRMVTAFFFPPGEEDKRDWLEPEGWQKLLNQAPHTFNRIQDANGQLLFKPQVVSAHSSVLERLQGHGWMAIGDAALCYDPIAAHGITMAMTSARDATAAIINWFEGDHEAPERYEALLWAAFQRYAQERQKFTFSQA